MGIILRAYCGVSSQPHPTGRIVRMWDLIANTVNAKNMWRRKVSTEGVFSKQKRQVPAHHDIQLLSSRAPPDELNNTSIKTAAAFMKGKKGRDKRL